MKRLNISGLMALLALAGCAPDFNPPPDYQGGYLSDSDRSRTVTVAEGDTLYSISRRYDVPTKIIAGRNGLREPYALTVGQSLILDPTKVHVVQGGDTLASIAQKYGVDQVSLASANDLPMAATQLRPGTEVWIPDPFTSAAGPVRMAANGSGGDTAMPPIMAAPRNSVAITSETLQPVPGARMAPPMTVTPVTPPVTAPGGISEAPLSAPVAVQPRFDSNSPGLPAVLPPALAPSAALPQPMTPSVPLAVAPPVPAMSAGPEIALAVPGSTLAPPPASASPAPGGARFAWPVTGKILARFGTAGKGLHNDGINIAAPAGTQVHAAEGGVVAYAGNQLKGFGNLLLVKHDDGMTTAYAHNDKLLVAKGDKVTQGQVIATVGRTGNVDSPQLHFEVRKGTQAMDPLDYLAKTGG